MSLTNPLPRGTRISPPYATDGVNAMFAVPFWFIDARDLQIIVVPASGQPITYLGGVGYTVSGAGNPGGGTVTLAAVPAAGGTVQIEGHRVPNRETSIVNSGVVVSAALEQEFDAVEATMQELRRDADLALALQGPGFNARGDWSGDTVYALGDVVSFGGSSWRALAASLDVQPGTDATKWFLIAEKGNAGPPGDLLANGGVATIDFGAWPGDDIASLAVADPSIEANAFIVGYLAATDSADHSADEHVIEEMDILCGSIVLGVGFTIFARTRTGKLYGQWNVNWLRR